MFERPGALFLLLLTVVAYAICMSFLPGAVTPAPGKAGPTFNDVAFVLNIAFFANLASFGIVYLFRVKCYRFREGSLASVLSGLFYTVNAVITLAALFSPVVLNTFPVFVPGAATGELSPEMNDLIRVSSASLIMGFCIVVLVGQAFGNELDNSPLT